MIRKVVLNDRVRYVREDDILHRTNGPAVIWNAGQASWFLYGKRHRYYGPMNNFVGQWFIHDENIK